MNKDDPEFLKHFILYKYRVFPDLFLGDKWELVVPEDKSQEPYFRWKPINKLLTQKIHGVIKTTSHKNKDRLQ